MAIKAVIKKDLSKSPDKKIVVNAFEIDLRSFVSFSKKDFSITAMKKQLWTLLKKSSQH
mgnify:CR=1 FL=1